MKNEKDQNQALNLPRLFGFLLFVGMMAAGYYYNLTFVQLGLDDFGTRWLGLSEAWLPARWS